MITAACVLRSGGEYKPEHVVDLLDGLSRYWPDSVPRRFAVFTDTPIGIHAVQEIKLRYDWPRWWAKLEVMNVDALPGDVLYVDLDTVILGDLKDIVEVNALTMLQDFYRKKDYVGSGLMYLPEADRALAWKRWLKKPEQYIRRHKVVGDQEFLETLWGERTERWQDILPGAVISFKAHVSPPRGCGHIAKDAKVMCFHGRPRPWNVDWRRYIRHRQEGGA